MKPRHLLGAGLAAAGAAAFYALMVEPRWLQLRRERVHLAHLPRPLEGLRIGLLTDLHVSGRRAPLLRRAVDRLVAARPDLVAVTGDLAEDEAGLRAVLAALRPLAPPLGLYAVPGNHDHVAGIRMWHRLVGDARHVQDLTNRSLLLGHRGVRLCIAGVDDLTEGWPRLRLPPPSGRDVTILLAHSPDQAERCRRRYDAVDLIISGHTHAGQIRLPFLGAAVRRTAWPELYDHGLRRRPWTQVYTSRGLGTTTLPLRFLARPEITVLELTAERRPSRRDPAAWTGFAHRLRPYLKPLPTQESSHRTGGHAHENPRHPEGQGRGRDHGRPGPARAGGGSRPGGAPNRRRGGAPGRRDPRHPE